MPEVDYIFRPMEKELLCSFLYDKITKKNPVLDDSPAKEYGSSWAKRTTEDLELFREHGFLEDKGSD